MKNQQGRFSTWPVSDPVRPALAPASPAPTGPWTGANRVISSKLGELTRSGSGRWPGLDRAGPVVRPVGPGCGPGAPAPTGPASAGQFVAPVKTKLQIRFGPAGPVPGPV